MGQQESDGLLSIRNAWMEGKAPMPSDPVSVFETNINILLALFLGKGTSILLGAERTASQPVTIINKLSGKALEVMNSSTDQGARIQQVTRNGAPNQRWFIKRTNFSKYMTIPGVIFREAHRYWPTFLRFPRVAYSVIADHSGLCLDIVNGSTDNGVAVQQPVENGGKSNLWAFIRDDEGFNFIVNLYSGQVLDVADNSLKNYAAVQQYPFNGSDSQRWQFFS
jgi:hypothetical protein